MKLREYSEWLIEFSKQFEIADENKLNCYIAGTGEEMCEAMEAWANFNFNSCDDSDTAIQLWKLELGDVLAYCVLAANKLDIDLTPYSGSDTDFNLIQLQILGYLKRIFRGDQNIEDRPKQIVIDAWKWLMEYLFVHGIELEDLIELNINKLKNRKQLVGSGNKR